MRAAPSAGRPWAVVEIGCDTDETARSALIRAAYRSSRSGLVALALRGVTTQSVDRVLDQIVDANDHELKGVVYLNGDDAPALLSAAAMAEIVIASTDGFRTELGARGIIAAGPDETAGILGAPAS